MAESVLKSGESTEGERLAGFDAANRSSAQFGPGELEACLENRLVRVEYQPKVALRSNQASQFGVEALCRICDPRFGAVSPDKFIAIAEANRLIAELTDAVVCEAFRAWTSWDAAGLRIRLALNVSPLLLSDGEWARFFLRRCSEFKIDPKWITLEITETAAGATSEQSGKILRELHEKGFLLSIDDFGTGFSSLSTLYNLPIAEMKIDKSFVLEMDRKPGAREVVESAVALGKRMGIKVVAEGVETEHVFEELRRIGCDEVQGFFVGKSIPADAVIPFFTTWQKSGGSGSAPRTLPKVAIIQALLNELVADITLPAKTNGRPYAAQTTPTISDNRITDLLLKIPPLVLGGEKVCALASCHDAIRALEKTPGGHAPHSRIVHLRSQLESELLTNRDLEICTPRKYRLLPRNAVTLGRSSSSVMADIPIQCSWINTGDKNLRIFWKNDQYFLEDLGSRHGHLVGGEKLDPKRPFPIPAGDTRVEISLASGGQAPVSLLLQRRFYDPDAILVDFEYDEQVLLAELGERAWSALKGQLENRWIICNGKISLGRSSGCSIVLRDCLVPIAATIAFEEGYWITPAAGVEFQVRSTTFRQRLPMIQDCEFYLAGAVVTANPVERADIAAKPAERALKLLKS